MCVTHFLTRDMSPIHIVWHVFFTRMYIMSTYNIYLSLYDRSYIYFLLLNKPNRCWLLLQSLDKHSFTIRIIHAYQNSNRQPWCTYDRHGHEHVYRMSMSIMSGLPTSHHKHSFHPPLSLSLYLFTYRFHFLHFPTFVLFFSCPFHLFLFPFLSIPFYTPIYTTIITLLPNHLHRSSTDKPFIRINDSLSVVLHLI